MSASDAAVIPGKVVYCDTDSCMVIPAPADPTSDYFQWRTAKLAAREAATGIPTYPHKFEVTSSVPKFIESYSGLEAGQRQPEVTVSLAGRLLSVRASGKKLVFYSLQCDGQTLQLWANLADYESPEAFAEITDTLARGDWVGAVGFPARTQKGELSLVPRRLMLLSPCLRTLPGARNELVDVETRHRKRWLDLIVNHDERRQVFVDRARIIRFIRRFFDNRGFLEVETPMMGEVASGAAAKPFVTHHNDLGIDRVMRISPELRLKELVVGGLGPVYELGRQFRNEGADLSHNPEFTSIETYQPFVDYHDLMAMTEELFSGLAMEIQGTHRFMIAPFGAAEVARENMVEVDFSPPFRRIPMIAELERLLNVTFPRPIDSEVSRQFLDDLCIQHKVECGEPRTITRLLDKLVGEFIEPQCINPTFIIDHPVICSPLAKWHRNDPELTERFELFINGKEICNAYTELNSSHRQRECFASQAKDIAAGDEEAQKIDEGYCEALDYGLPPTGGWGCGIDRLVCMLTGQSSIREVLLFPALRPL